MISNGAPKSLAEENALKWNVVLRDRIESELTDWEGLGVPKPMGITNRNDICITWRHAHFRKIEAAEPLPSTFAEVNQWVRECAEHRLLFVAACMLKVANADPIFVTDATGDGGIDLIGRIPTGVFRSTMILVQSKSSVNRVSREIVLQEYGKYSALFRSTVYSDYRSALQLSSSIDGVSNCYMFLSNNEYKTSTRRVAADLDILLRSRRQIAYLLSRVADRAKLEKIEKSLGTLKRDLTLNLARKINF